MDTLEAITQTVTVLVTHPPTPIAAIVIISVVALLKLADIVWSFRRRR